jgi:hypothetical protein
LFFNPPAHLLSLLPVPLTPNSFHPFHGRHPSGKTMFFNKQPGPPLNSLQCPTDVVEHSCVASFQLCTLPEIFLGLFRSAQF